MLPKWVVPVACYYAIFAGGAGFLFGQAFFGDYSLGATLAGAGGVIAASLTWSLLNWHSRFDMSFRVVAGLGCALALVGVAMEAIDFYRHLNDVPGNSFSWHLIGPYVASLLLISYENILAFRHRAATGYDA